MCGIAGFVGKGTGQDLSAMIATVHHRGPDDQGALLKDNVGLGHTRLAVIDLSPTGHQPMWDLANTCAIVFNGEIYNFRKLRKTLEQYGYRFKSASDTEVILNAYKQWGTDCFARFKGMFALALYDFNNRKLILARDPLGKKPLYWGKFDNTLLFGSELKTLIAHGAFKKELDYASLTQYLFYESIPTPRSIWASVKKLEPGSYLIYDGKTIISGVFWRPDYTPINIPFPDALRELDRRIAEATETRLISDVPLGVFLSGGIDSSTVAYYAQRASTQRIKTFSIGFGEESYDESDYARLVAHHLNTEHFESTVTAQEMLKIIPQIPDIFDEPVADASVIPTYLLARFARKNITVSLGGDGGDELFSGYQTFIADKFTPLAPLIRTLGTPLDTFLNASEGYFSFDFKIRQFLRGFADGKTHRHSYWLAAFLPTEISKLLAEKSRLETIFAPIEHRGVLEMYLRTYLMDQVLVKVDRACMKNALEVRTPFLDVEVVNFCNSLPYKYKVHGLTTKYILKRLMKDKLPKEIARRKKKGFAIPLARWLKHDLRRLCEELLSPTRIKREGLFNTDYIEQLKKEHFEGKRNNRKQLWTLMVFQMWRERWY